MNLIDKATRLAEGDDNDQRAAIVYALAAVVSQLESIDDALRNTIGGTPR